MRKRDSDGECRQRTLEVTVARAVSVVADAEEEIVADDRAAVDPSRARVDRARVGALHPKKLNSECDTCCPSRDH